MCSLIHEEITSEIIASAFEISNTLGTGFLEKVYENSLKYELELRGLYTEAQKQIFVYYKGREVGKYQIDILVENKVIIEVKSTEEISPIHRAQLLNYLKATGVRIGLIINFGKTKVQLERILQKQI